MKQKLEAIGWKCSPCNCPGRKGVDCVHEKFKGVVIAERGTGFRIVKNSLIIESAFVYQLDEKLKLHGLV